MTEAVSLPTSLGRYQVVEELGRGAMGIVYLGVDPVIARPVAIKVVRESEQMTPAEVEQFQARFRHEAEAAGRLSHPDIVQVYDIGSNYMVMEFVEGRPLSAVLREGTSFSVRQVVALVQRAADAIDYAHRNGIVHRDIKPGNVMLLGAGGLKVMDFGVARLDTSNLTAAGSVIGSVRYMAPEQMMGEKVDGRADVFSLAAVAYELLTAEPPFPGDTITDVVSRVVRGAHVPPCAVESRLPPACDNVFARAFAKRPVDRHARALDFARDLAEAARPALDVVIVHQAHAELPTDADATAEERGDADTETQPAARSLVPAAAAGPQPEQAKATSATEAGVAEAAGSPEPDTLEGPLFEVPEPAPVRATARTVIMELSRSRREGVLLLESDPSGAAAFVDGVRVGTTPVPEHELRFGSHEVRLEAPDCEPATIELELLPERPMRAITVTLAPARPQDGSLRPGQFVALGPEVHPPCRVAGALPAYPAAARERGLAGAPVAEVWIGPTGEVMDLAIVESAGAILDGALLEAVVQWRFTPARLRGVPVSTRITVQHYFNA